MRKGRVLFAVGLALAAGSAAWAFPWDIDMVDAYFFRGYEWKMMGVPEGAVSRSNYVANSDRMTPEGQALTNPYDDKRASVATGQEMFDIYCTTCHGAEGKGGAPVTDNNPAEGRNRYPVPPPMLSGPGAISSLRSDGYLYLTIRNGGAIMPAYGAAMDDHEMWAIVRYIRTLDGAKFNAPTGG